MVELLGAYCDIFKKNPYLNGTTLYSNPAHLSCNNDDTNFTQY